MVKFEIRSTKFEANSKVKKENFDGLEPFEVLQFFAFWFASCFDSRISKPFRSL